ncbi:hypothetical protein [Kitasatospora sp. NPDC093558]|uniref:hypothetical protein n=1 Tax=Kitasatospora sp. NPDC093558 TaxID=3155201 RepID=UPI003447D543
MTTTTETHTTAGTQINAVGALMSLFSAHAGLPAARITSERVVTAERDPSGALVCAWGLALGFHSVTALADFEQWRHALGIDPAAVEHETTGTFAWLIVTTTHAGTPLTLVGYYTLAQAAASDER